MELAGDKRSEACGDSSEAVIESQHSEKHGGNSSSSSHSSNEAASAETVIDVRSEEEEEVQEHEKISKVEDGDLVNSQVVAGETKLLGDQEARVVNVDQEAKGRDKVGGGEGLQDLSFGAGPEIGFERIVPAWM